MFNGIFNIGKQDDSPPRFNTMVDLHSHLIPGIDDGVKTIEESLAVLKRFEALGLKKVITTPHIFQEYYPNTPKSILQGLEDVRYALRKAKIDIELNAAAEYYMDEFFVEQLKTPEKLLTINEQYILVETSFYSQPVFFDDVLFQMFRAGLKPIFAHPERYSYINQNQSVLKELRQKGMLLQLNLGSLQGMYSKEAKRNAEYMIKNGLVDFVSTDCHNLRSISILEQATKSKLYQKIDVSQLKNNELL